MKEIKVLGSGCKKCVKAAELIQTVANDCEVPVNIVKESSPELMLKYGVIKTPAVIVDEQLMHSGSVPDRKQVVQWFE